MFKTIDPLATNLGNRLGVLHRSFIDINTDIKTLSKSNGGIKNFGHLFNIATKQDIQNFEQFNRVVEDGQNVQRSYDTYLSSAPTSLRQLGSAIVDVKKEQYNLNTAYHQGKISQDEYNNKMQTCNTRLQELRNSSNSLTLSQKALNTVMSIGSTILNMAFNAAIGIAISAIISAIQKAVNAEQELIQKNKELADTYEDNIKTLKNYREQYLEILDSSDSEVEKDKQLIEWKKQLVKQYGLEEEALQQVNQERQTGLDLINQELYKEADLTIANLKDYEDAYNKIYNAQSRIHNLTGWNAMRGFEDYGINFNRVSNGNGSFNISVDYNTTNAYEQLDKLEKLLVDLKTKSTQLDKNDPLYTQFHASVNNQIEFVQKEYDRVKQVIDDYGTTVSTGVSAYAQKYLYEFTQQTDGALANVIDQATFNTWKDKLLEMAGDSEPVKEALAKLADEMFPNYSSAANDSANSTNNTTTSVTSLTDTFTALKKALEDIIGYADTYQSAMSKIAAGTALTADEVMELLELDPTLFDKFVKDKDGWKIDLGDLQVSYSLKVDSAKDNIVGSNKEDLQKQLETEQANLDGLIAEKAGLVVNDSVTRALAANLDKQISEAKSRIEQIEQDIGLSDTMSNVMDYSSVELANDSFKIVTDTIKDYNSEIKSLNDAIDTLNEGNSLSYDDMTELVNLYPQLENKVVKTADGYTIEKSALEDVRQQSYTTRNDFIDDQIKMLETTIETTRERIRLYYAEIGALNNYYEAKKAFEDTAVDRQTIADLSALIDVLNGFKNEVVSPDSSSSKYNKDVTDKLQQQIDYYKMLLEAVEIVTDKVIDSLEQEKEALKEKNDEQQRELDLLEAKNNLEKAKKQKVFVYKEGQGLVQVQDEKAIADAQKEYDNAQNEIKEAEIDKKIDNWTKYKEQFSNMENDVKDTLTVEQGKKALGTDEKGLLSLDDKTINGIRNGLAEAVYKKDVEDNKDNDKYVSIDMDTYLKQLGASVSYAEFQNIANNLSSVAPAITPMTNNTTSNSQTITNSRMINMTNNFNIYDAINPQKVLTEVRKYMQQLLTDTINSTK